MLLAADAKKLHDLKHEPESQETVTEPVYSSEKLRHRRLKTLENRYQDKRYQKLQKLFEKIRVEH